jgi:hypothetical protein
MHGYFSAYNKVDATFPLELSPWLLFGIYVANGTHDCIHMNLPPAHLHSIVYWWMCARAPSMGANWVIGEQRLSQYGQ